MMGFELDIKPSPFVSPDFICPKKILLISLLICYPKQGSRILGYTLSMINEELAGSQ